MVKLRFFSVAVVVLLIGIASCSGDAASPETRNPTERLRSGETAFLTTLDIDQVDPAEGYPIGRALEAQGMRESARSVYRRVLEESSVPSVFKGVSAARLSGLSAQERDWSAARLHAAVGLEYTPQFGDLWFQYGRALYEGEEYRQLRDWIPEIPRSDGLAWEEWSARELDAEALLWAAVVAIEIAGDETDAVLRLFTRLPASAVHRRVYLYLYYENELARFTRNDAQLIEAVYRVSVGENQEALRLFSLLDEVAFARLVLIPDEESDGLYRTLEQAIIAAGTADLRWLDRLDVAVSGTEAIDGGPATTIFARLALLRAAAGAEDRVDRLIEATARLGERDPDLRDRLTNRRRVLEIDAGLPIETMIEHARTLEEDAESYEDVIEAMLPAIVRDREWERLAAIREMIPPEAEYSRARIALLLAVAEEWSRTEGGDPAAALTPLMDLSPTDYYGLVARRILGTDVGNLSDRQSGSNATIADIRPGGESPETAAAADLEATLARALLDAGLPQESYLHAMRWARSAEVATDALKLAELYHAYGYASQALGLARRAIVRGELPVGDGEIALLYPQPYRGEFAAITDRYEIAPALMYGLVREESHFNHRAQSPVGAQGLAQLIPATAEDMQRRMRLSSFDVFDPTDNLTMGAYYLAYLAGEIDSPVLRVAAYNAGLGRGRTWMALFGDLPPLLQIEAVPFLETRWYLRRIAVSAAWYGRQLDGTDPVRGLDILLTGGL